MNVYKFKCRNKLIKLDFSRADQEYLRHYVMLTDTTLDWTAASAPSPTSLHAFWTSLTAQERHSLIQIEKEAILRKVREQQRGTCNCATCGRKRVVVEKELEGLYDMYYQELERGGHRSKAESGNPLLDLGSSLTAKGLFY